MRDDSWPRLHLCSPNTAREEGKKKGGGGGGGGRGGEREGGREVRGLEGVPGGKRNKILKCAFFNPFEKGGQIPAPPAPPPPTNKTPVRVLLNITHTQKHETDQYN